MSKISIERVQLLRERTGLGLMDCRKAFEETAGILSQQLNYYAKKVLLLPQNVLHMKLHKGLYMHTSIQDQLGVMVEINCETDFVASTEDMKTIRTRFLLAHYGIKTTLLSP